MQIEQTLHELFWNPTDLASLPSLVLRLVVAAVLGILLGQAYVHFGQALSNRKLFARNFIVLTVTTALIISIVRSSVALSLGLVGALSIVRFRAAIKEPEGTAFLFLSLMAGPHPHLAHFGPPALFCGLDRDPHPLFPPPRPAEPLPDRGEPRRREPGRQPDSGSARRRRRERNLETLRPDAGPDRGCLRCGLQASRPPGAVQPTAP